MENRLGGKCKAMGMMRLYDTTRSSTAEQSAVEAHSTVNPRSSETTIQLIGKIADDSAPLSTFLKDNTALVLLRHSQSHRGEPAVQTAQVIH